jgi:hypothetical protein
MVSGARYSSVPINYSFSILIVEELWSIAKLEAVSAVFVFLDFGISKSSFSLKVLAVAKSISLI